MLLTCTAWRDALHRMGRAHEDGLLRAFTLHRFPHLVRKPIHGAVAWRDVYRSQLRSELLGRAGLVDSVPECVSSFEDYFFDVELYCGDELIGERSFTISQPAGWTETASILEFFEANEVPPMLRNRDSVAKFELRVRVTDRRMRTVLLYDGAMEDLAAVNEAYFKWLDLPWTKVALDTQGWFHYVPRMAPVCNGRSLSVDFERCHRPTIEDPYPEYDRGMHDVEVLRYLEHGIPWDRGVSDAFRFAWSHPLSFCPRARAHTVQGAGARES